MDNNEVNYLEDISSKEKYQVEFSEANMQIWPVVWFIGGLAAKYVIKKYGKKVVMKI